MYTYENQIKFEVSLHFWRIWPIVRRRRRKGAMHSVLPQGCNVLLGVPEIVVHRVYINVI